MKVYTSTWYFILTISTAKLILPHSPLSIKKWGNVLRHVVSCRVCKKKEGNKSDLPCNHVKMFFTENFSPVFALAIFHVSGPSVGYPFSHMCGRRRRNSEWKEAQRADRERLAIPNPVPSFPYVDRVVRTFYARPHLYSVCVMQKSCFLVSKV